MSSNSDPKPELESESEWEHLREDFEADCLMYGFDTTRQPLSDLPYPHADIEPWFDYEDVAVGWRWSGFIAGAERQTYGH